MMISGNLTMEMFIFINMENNSFSLVQFKEVEWSEINQLSMDQDLNTILLMKQQQYSSWEDVLMNPALKQTTMLFSMCLQTHRTIQLFGSRPKLLQLIVMFIFANVNLVLKVSELTMDLIQLIILYSPRMAVYGMGWTE